MPVPFTLERVCYFFRWRFIFTGVKPRFFVPVLTPGSPMPDPSTARPDGLLAIGGDLSLPRLLEAYGKGVFPWSADPITWWSPDPRSVIPLEGFHVPQRLRRKIRSGRFTITFDNAFDRVMQACAAPAAGRESTWIEGGMFEAYGRLHRAGHAHSVECWDGDTLAGGVYGVSIGGFFAGESMFHHVTDASKIALSALMDRLRHNGFLLFDTQAATPHTRRLGAIDIPRADYLKFLQAAIQLPVRFG